MRGIVASLALAAAVALGVVVPAAPVSAAPLPLEFSSDGVHWSTAAPTSVLPGGLRIVPGDEVSQTIYLRTTRATPVELSMVITGITFDDPLLGLALSLATSPSVGGGLPEMPIADIVSCTTLMSASVVRPGQVVALTLTVALSDTLVGQMAQNATANFNIVAGMSDVGGRGAVAGCGNGPVIPYLPEVGGTESTGGGTIAHTGADAVLPALAIAAAVLFSGWLLVLIARRRNRRAEEVRS